MKKEYKAPNLCIVSVVSEELMLPASQEHPYDSGDAKKSGRTFEDDEDIAPAAPKKFWDDEN